MTKLRKQRRRKVFRHSINRKRLRNKINSQGNIGCKEIKNAWDDKKSCQANLNEMGLSYDPNVTLKKKSNKAKAIAKLMETDDEWKVEDAEDSKAMDTASKKHVVDALIEDATAPRAKMFRLPKGQVEHLSYMLTKHGLNFKAMAKDRKNSNQDTWKQLRSKIKRFQTIPEQYNPFLEAAGKDVVNKLQKEVHMDEDD